MSRRVLSGESLIHRSAGRAARASRVEWFSRAARSSALALAWVLSSACAPDSTTASTAASTAAAVYSKDGVSFAHAAGWKVASDEAIPGGQGLRLINLEGPGDALVMLTLMPSPANQTLEQYAQAIARERAAAFEAALSVGQVRPASAGAAASGAATSRVGGVDRAGIAQRFTVSVLGQQVPHEANFFLLPGKDTTAFIVTQVASDKAKDAAPAFAVTLDSLRVGKAE